MKIVVGPYGLSWPAKGCPWWRIGRFLAGRRVYLHVKELSDGIHERNARIDPWSSLGVEDSKKSSEVVREKEDMSLRS